MLDTSVGKFLSHLKILAADFNRIRISFLKLCCIIMILSCCFVFFFFFLDQLSLRQKETDGPVSALLLTGELEACQFLAYFWFVLVQGLSATCAQKIFLAFGEALLLQLKMERAHGELTIWSVTGVDEGCWLSVTLAITRQGQGLFSGPGMIRYDMPWPHLCYSTL